MAVEYGREKLWQAVNALATGSGSIQERLENAAIFLIRLQAGEDLPEEHRATFEAILHELTKEQATGDEGNIRATLANTSSERGRALAGRILSLYTELHGGI